MSRQPPKEIDHHEPKKSTNHKRIDMSKRAKNLADSIQPVHEHDCEACIFTGQRKVNDNVIYDFYYCPKCDGGTIIARWDVCDDYCSCVIEQMMTRPREADYPLDWAYAAFVVAGW